MLDRDMRGGAFDFSSWQGVLSTLVGLVVVSLVAVGIRLAVMQSVQRRRERANRQINERLKTLIAAYKTLGGSFTGELAVDPRHLRDLRRIGQGADASGEDASAEDEAAADARAPFSESPGAERRRRTRDAVEAALSDIILLGTEEQVRLAVRAANEMVAGRSVEIAELVVSLRTFIRDVLDLEPVPAGLEIPRQGPLRTGGASRGGGGGGRGERSGGGAGGGRGGGGMAAGGTGAGGMAGGMGGAALLGGAHLRSGADVDPEGAP
jgi:type II secretory pathway pseudopilin PulG